MKALSLCVFIGVSTLFPCFAAPQETGSTVIAIFDDGVKMTLDEYNALLEVNKSWAGQDRTQVINKYAVLRKAAQFAKDKGLDQKSPNKEALAFNTMFAMAQYAASYMAENATVAPAEVEKYYNEHKGIYKQVNVSAIKVAYGTAPAAAPAAASSNASRPVKKALTEEEAKAKADKLVQQIRAGADFGKLVLLESDDENTKTKGGKVGSMKMSDNVPELMRSTVLSLEAGQITDPIPQGDGYYIFHADEIVFAPLSEVQDSIFQQLKGQKVDEWVSNLTKTTVVNFPKQKEPEPPAAPTQGKK